MHPRRGGHHQVNDLLSVKPPRDGPAAPHEPVKVPSPPSTPGEHTRVAVCKVANTRRE